MPGGFKGRADKEEKVVVQAESMDKPAEKVVVDGEESCPCGSCLKDVTSEGVCCDLCGNWYHCRCQGISEQLYKALKQFKKELHWFCRGCHAGAEKLLQIVSRIQTKVDRIEEEVVRVTSDIRTELATAIKELRCELKQIDSRITAQETRTTNYQHDLQTSIDSKLSVLEDKVRNETVSGVDGASSKSWADIVSKEVDSKLHGVTAEMTVLQLQAREMQMDKDEQAEITKRKNNVIIHGLPEPEGVSGEERKKKDEDKIVDMLLQIRCDEISITNCVRLGKQPSNPNEKPRPIKLVLVSEGQKDKLLYNAKNLRGRSGLEGVFIHQDLTPAQRLRRHKLVEELKRRQTLGEANLIIVSDRIVQRRTRNNLAALAELTDQTNLVASTRTQTA